MKWGMLRVSALVDKRLVCFHGGVNVDEDIRLMMFSEVATRAALPDMNCLHRFPSRSSSSISRTESGLPRRVRQPPSARTRVRRITSDQIRESAPSRLQMAFSVWKSESYFASLSVGPISKPQPTCGRYRTGFGGFCTYAGTPASPRRQLQASTANSYRNVYSSLRWG